MELMRAAVLERPCAPLRLTRVPVPEPGPGEILLRLEASGVCHTDVHVWKGEVVPPVAPDPFILGHEGIGRVVAVGPDGGAWAVGDRAGAAWQHDACGICDECRSGQESFCQVHRAHGFNVPGTFAEYVIAKADFVVRIPEGPAAELAPLMCAGLTAYGALDRAALREGETCAIFGCGGLGLYAVQLAARRGARVLAVDADPAKLALAQNLGASEIRLAGDALPSGCAHVTVNFAPTARTWPGMTAVTRPMGRIVAAAMVSEPVALNQEWLTASGITLSGASVGTRAQMRALMALHQTRPLAAEILPIALDDVTDALAALADGRAKGRYCIRF